MREIVIKAKSDLDKVDVCWPDGSKVEYTTNMPDAMYQVDVCLSNFFSYRAAPGTPIGGPVSNMQSQPEGAGGLQYKTLPDVEALCVEHSLEINYWQGQWSVRRSGETKTENSQDLLTALTNMRIIK